MARASTRVDALTRHVGATFALPVRAVEIADEGWGGVTLRANARVGREVRVVETPFATWATRSAAFAERAGSRAFLASFARGTVRDTVALMMHTLHEKKAGDATSYAGSCLPESFRFVDACLREDDVGALRGTDTEARARARGEFVRTLSTLSNVPIDDIAWALGAVSSRAMKSKAVPEFALVPGCDLLDHDGEPNCEVRRDGGSTPDVYIATTREIAPGEALTISYGDLGNDRALRMYGFCDETLFKNDTRRGGVHPSRGEDAFAKTLDAQRLDEWLADQSSWRDDASEARDDEWFRNVSILRRGQKEIIDAYVRALDG
jgi:hypothetical protein